MALEPYCNVDDKTGAGSEFSSKNVLVMAKKLKLIWNQNAWVFLAILVKIHGFQNSEISTFQCYPCIFDNFEQNFW